MWYRIVAKFVLLFIVISLIVPPSAQAEDVNLNNLSKGQIWHGFACQAVYLNDEDKPIGARFLHQRTGFLLDTLSIQSVPQGFIWVNTAPTSDRGEAHTQEHLLLGKGNKGRSVATLEDMSLSASSAMTMQWRTCYHFNTLAGPDVFYDQTEKRLDALLHPDYTDTEIQREVRHFGITRDATTKELRLEEKGTVYNEMVSAVNDETWHLWRAQAQAVYGSQHPLYFASGGTPEGIRQLTPADIRNFHKQHYQLNNMGMIASFPESMSLDSLLQHMDAILNQVGGTTEAPVDLTKGDVPSFPPPQAMLGGSVEIVTFPNKDKELPGTIQLSYPAALKLDSKHELLLTVFLRNVAGDASTALYRKFIDSKTRIVDFGATSVSGGVSDDQGFPVEFGLDHVLQSHINKKDIELFRSEVLKEIARVASWKDGSSELTEFNARVRRSLKQTKRNATKFVNSPPGFGVRWNQGSWMSHFLRLERTDSFRRSVTFRPEIAFATEQLDGKTNLWRPLIKQWHLLDTVPYAFGTKPDPQLQAELDAQKKERVDRETDRLMKLYATSEPQVALAKYKTEFEADTAALERLAQSGPQPRLVDSLPMTLDDQLLYNVKVHANGVKSVASTFESMAGATTAIALRLDCIEQSDLFLLTSLPDMLASVGLIENGKPIPYDVVLQRLREEILSLSANFSTNMRTGRCELVVSGAGNDGEESRRAVGWLKLVLQHPDWRVGNLPRIRDAIDQELSGLRRVRESSYEESWVRGVEYAYWRQGNPLLMATRSFLTQTYNAQRLRWLLKGDGPPETIQAFVQFMNKVSACGSSASRDDLQELLSMLEKKKKPQEVKAACAADLQGSYAHLAPPVEALVAEAGKDLTACLPDIPDASLHSDWIAICAQISGDVQVPPVETLKRFQAMREKILTTGGARGVVIGSQSIQNKLEAPIETLLETLKPAPFKPSTYTTEPLVTSRLKEREPEAEHPLYVGLVNENTRQGVIMNSVPALKYEDLDDESFLNLLAFQLYAGGGAHSAFMKTWGAGLAYGNGLSGSPNWRLSYYADKTPELPETLRFVIELLKHAKPDEAMPDYCLAQEFDSRAADAYETRGMGIAADLEDGTPPEVVRKFRTALLKIRQNPNLSAELYKRMIPQCAKVLPGLGLKGSTVDDALFMVIGDDKQLKLYEDYLKTVEGPETRLYRLYGRDFWVMP